MHQALVQSDPVAGALETAATDWIWSRDRRALRRVLLRVLADLEE